MKIENTPENKARFEALYLNQRVWKSHNFEKLPAEILTSDKLGKQNTVLSLRSISSLTDEEATTLAKIINCYASNREIKTEPHSKIEFGKEVRWLRIFYWYKDELDRDVQRILYNVSNGCISHPSGNCYFEGWAHAADYLRSIGILIPWMDLSGEQIIDFGWAKIAADD